MNLSYNHQLFDSPDRASQALCNDRCQNILYKAVFEHFIETKNIAALLLASKSFQNSSFGANFLVNVIVDDDRIRLIDSFLSPSSCFSCQFVPSLRIIHATKCFGKINRSISNFAAELVKTKYLHLSLRSLSLEEVKPEVLSFFFGSTSTSNSWPHLQELTLRCCGVTADVMSLIVKNAPQLRTVNFARNPETTDAALQHVAALSGLTSLNLSCCFFITDAGLLNISTLSRITCLHLSMCHLITDAGLEHVAKLSSVTILALQRCNEISDAGLAHFAKLGNLTALNLGNCWKITDRGIGHITKLSGMTHLLLQNCGNITDAAFENVANGTNMQSLTLDGCDKITDAGLEHVSKFSSINFLDLSNCKKITDAGLGAISRCSNITTLNLGRCENITDVGLECISKLSGITSLNLRNCELITDVGIEHISNLSRITSLDLSCLDKITGVGLQYVLKFSGISHLVIHGTNKNIVEAKIMLKAVLPNCTLKDRIGKN